MKATRIKEPVDRGQLENALLYERDSKRREWLQIILFRLDGLTPSVVAEKLKITQEKVRRIVHRFNEGGLQGCTIKPCGAPKKLTEEQEAQLRRRILDGPLESDNVSEFQGSDIQRIVKQEFGVEYKDRSIYSVLQRLGLSQRNPRASKRDEDHAKYLQSTEMNYQQL